MMQFRIEFVVTLDHQAKLHRRTGQCPLQSGSGFLVAGVIGDGGANAVIL